MNSRSPKFSKNSRRKRLSDRSERRSVSRWVSRSMTCIFRGRFAATGAFGGRTNAGLDAGRRGRSGAILLEARRVREHDRHERHRRTEAERAPRAPALAEAVHVVALAAPR